MRNVAQVQTAVRSEHNRQSIASLEARHPARLLWRRLRKNRIAMVGMVVLVAIHVAALLASTLAPQDPTTIDLVQRLRPPSTGHLLGTDENGRDVFSRLLYGSRISLAIGLAAMVFSIAAGTLLGGVAGFVGGSVDAVLMRLTDGMLSIPLFFFLLTTLALLGSSLPVIIIVIGLISWMPVARLVRADVLRTLPQEFVLASRAIGAGDARIFFVHVLPQAIPSVIVAATLGVANAILIESALSYLGLGVQPPVASWGNMLSNARGYLWSAPLLAIYPGAMIFLTVLLYNWMGDGLRDALDPTAPSF